VRWTPTGPLTSVARSSKPCTTMCARASRRAQATPAAPGGSRSCG
jgi:hypothetical protein